MKCLLVFAMCLAAVCAQDIGEMKDMKTMVEMEPMVEMKEMEIEMPKETVYAAPMMYNTPYAYVPRVAYHAPIAYNTPFAYNSPIAYNTPFAYNQWAAAPVAVAAPVKEVTIKHQPIVTKYVAKPYEIPVRKIQFEQVDTGCKNSFGINVPCAKSKREAEHHIAYAAHQPFVYAHQPAVYAHQPTVYNYKTLEPKVHEIGVPQPYYKEYVEKVSVLPSCTNYLGMPVPCVL
jgi:hypothetical protein